MARFPRVEALLGERIAGVDEAALQRLVDNSAREDADLEFKRELYGNSDSAKRALAGDVAGLANAVGGILILGVREDKQAAATELMPVPLSDDEEVRMRQVVAANVAPHPLMRIHRAKSQGGEDHGYYLVEVPKSPLQPHAVRVNEALRYPKRDGKGLRWLSESEVADAYRNRFLSVQGEVERIAIVHREGREALPQLGEYAWLSVALTPTLPGSMELTQRRLQDFQHADDGGQVPRLTGSVLMESLRRVSAGHRRVVVNLGQDDHGRPTEGLLHLHTDGSSYASAKIGLEIRKAVSNERHGVVRVSDEQLTQEVLTAIALLGRHALHACGAVGEALLEGTIVSDMPLNLGQTGGTMARDWNAHPIDRVPVGRHTVVLDDIMESARGLAIAARMLLNDLVQGFGVPEVPHISTLGALRRTAFGLQARGVLDTEARRVGLDLVDEVF